MATYNGERFLREQVDSILASIGEGDELIASDDGSTDGTLTILREYARIDSRVSVVNGPRRGVIENFSNAIGLARGDIIFLSDQDDVWMPNKTKRVLEEFEEQSCSLVVHNAQIIDEHDVPTGETLFDLRSSRPGFIKNMIKNSYVGCCMAFRSELVFSFAPIPTNVEMHDWWIGLVAEKCSAPVFIEDILIGYRRHTSNVSSMNHYGFRKMVGNRLTLLGELRRHMRQIREVTR